MNLTEISIKRPVVAWVMSLVLVIFGMFVFSELPVRELPEGIQPPVVQVQTDYKSASTEIIDEEIILSEYKRENPSSSEQNLQIESKFDPMYVVFTPIDKRVFF